MQYIHANLQITSKKVADEIAQNGSEASIELFYCILNFKDIVSILSQYLRFIDYYSLKRVSKHFRNTALDTFYKVDDLISIKLKGENLLDIVDKSNTAISGSLTLRILLSTPYQMPLWIEKCFNCITYGYRWTNSDIDSYSESLEQYTCPICNATVYGISALSLYLCNGLTWSRHYRGHGSPNNIKTDYDFSIMSACNKCKVNNIFFNDVVMKKNTDIGQFIRSEFDFDFLKNYYMNGKLHISYPESVLKNSCDFTIKHYENVDIFSDESNIFKGKLLNQERTLLIRYKKYIGRGFDIKLKITENDKMKLIEFYNETMAQYIDPVHKYQKIIKRLNAVEIIE